MLSAVVQIDLHGANAPLVVTGTVTDATQRAVHPLVNRVPSISPGAVVWMDRTRADRVEPTAGELLPTALRHDHPDSGAGSAKATTPAERLEAPLIQGFRVQPRATGWEVPPRPVPLWPAPIGCPAGGLAHRPRSRPALGGRRVHC